MRLFSTHRQLLLCWILQTLLLLSQYNSVSAQQLTTARECNTQEDCDDGFDCQAEHCIPKDCVARQLKALSLQIDPSEYKDMIFREAGVTDRDLERAKKESNSDEEFAQNPQVQALMTAVQSHSEELAQIGEIIRACEEGTAEQSFSESESEDESRRGIGSLVGGLFSAALNLFEFDTPMPSTAMPSGRPSSFPSTSKTPSAAPSTSSQPSLSSAPSKTPTMSPTASPSHAPSNPPSIPPTVSHMPSSSPSGNPTVAFEQQRTYIGIHMEGGLFIDYAFSLFSDNTPNSPTSGTYQYKRGCFGAELGGGFEVSIIVIITSNKRTTDIVGGSFVAEQDIAFGGALGMAVGLYVTGEAFGSDCPFYYEVTLGGGVGFGVGGALCRTGLIF